MENPEKTQKEIVTEAIAVKTESDNNTQKIGDHLEKIREHYRKAYTLIC